MRPYMNRNDLHSFLHKFVRQNRRRCHNNAKRHRDGHDADYRKMYDGRLCDEQSEVLKRIFEQRKSDHRSRKRRYEPAYTLWQTPYKTLLPQAPQSSLQNRRDRRSLVSGTIENPNLLLAQNKCRLVVALRIHFFILSTIYILVKQFPYFAPSAHFTMSKYTTNVRYRHIQPPSLVDSHSKFNQPLDEIDTKSV